MTKYHPLDVWTRDIAFYLNSSSFVNNSDPADQARAPRGMAWRKPGEGLDCDCAAKGSKVGSGGKVVKAMATISYGKGVLIAEPYEKLNGNE